MTEVGTTGMTLVELNGVKIYNLSKRAKAKDLIGATAADKEKEKKEEGMLDALLFLLLFYCNICCLSLCNTYTVYVDNGLALIQDFEFPATCEKIKISKDGQYLLSSGIYPPQMHCHDVQQLSLKFSRNFDAQVVDFTALTDDYSKMVFMRCDRYLDFHAKVRRKKSSDC